MRQIPFLNVLLALTLAITTRLSVIASDWPQPTPVDVSEVPLAIREPRLFTVSNANRYALDNKTLYKISPAGERLDSWRMGSQVLEGADGALYGIEFYTDPEDFRGSPSITTIRRLSPSGEVTVLKTLTGLVEVSGWARVGSDFYFLQTRSTPTGNESALAKVTPTGVVTTIVLPPDLTEALMAGSVGADFLVNDVKGNVLRMNTRGQYTNILPLCGGATLLKDGSVSFLSTGRGRVYRLAGRNLVPITPNQTIKVKGIGSDGHLYGFGYDHEPSGKPQRLLRLKTDGDLAVITVFAPDQMPGALVNEDGGHVYFKQGAAFFRLPATPLPNSPPIARDDDALVGPTPATIPVLRNDSDLEEGSIARIKSVGKPSLGTAVINGRNIVYTPGPNFRKQDSFTYTIADQNGEQSTATVRVISWNAVKGSHILELDANLDDTLRFGRVVLTITGPGTYTASSVFGHKYGVSRSSHSGSLDATGELALTLPSHPGVITLVFDIAAAVDGEVPVERKTFSEFDEPYAGVTYRPKRAPSTLIGRYTLVSDPEDKSNAAWAVFTIQQTGRVVVTGRTSQGFAFSAGAYLDADNVFRYFAGTGSSLETHKAASGKIILRNSPASDGDGYIMFGSEFANLGFVELPTVASRYTPPAARQPWFTYPTSAGTVKMTATLENPYPPGTIEATALLGSVDRATATVPLQSLVFQRRDAAGQPSGTFRGKIVLPGSSAGRSFSGVIFQKTNSAAGFVEKTNTLGPVRVEIAPQ